MATKIDNVAEDRLLCSDAAKACGFEVLSDIESAMQGLPIKEEHQGGLLVRTPDGDYAFNPLKCQRSHALLARAMKTDMGEGKEADRRALVQAAVLKVRAKG